MEIRFEDCSSFERLSVIFLVGFIFLCILAGYFVFTNRLVEKKMPFIFNLLEGVDVFFTSKYLNKLGKIWRIPFVISVFYIVCWYFYVDRGFCLN